MDGWSILGITSLGFAHRNDTSTSLVSLPV
jgi:hypothetical protein